MIVNTLTLTLTLCFQPNMILFHNFWVWEAPIGSKGLISGFFSTQHEPLHEPENLVLRGSPAAL